MKKRYETPDFMIILLDYDVLTTSDNDAPFDGEDDEEQDWSQYY